MTLNLPPGEIAEKGGVSLQKPEFSAEKKNAVFERHIGENRGKLQKGVGAQEPRTLACSHKMSPDAHSNSL